MMEHLNLFLSVARIAMPTFSVGPTRHAHKARLTGHRRSPLLDAPLAAIAGGIVCCRYQRQFAALLARGPNIASTAPTGASIERP
jgi:hypothetical protein